MSYEPINWKDRIVEKPRTYYIQNNPDGTVTLIPAPGTVVQEGTPVNAANLNHMEQGLITHLAEKATEDNSGHVKLKDISLPFTMNSINTLKWVCPGWTFEGIAANVFTKDQIVYTPIFIAETITFKEVGIYVGAGVADTSVELALYKRGTSGLPYELVQNFGTINTSSSGNKSIAINLTLSRGHYFTALRSIGGNPSLHGVDINKPYTSPVSAMSSSPNNTCRHTLLTKISGATTMGEVAQPPNNGGLSSSNAVRFLI